MGLFIIVGLLIFLVLTEISLCDCPFLCKIIGVSFKKNKEYVVCFLLLLAIILYIIACAILEQNIDGWCYLVYAGIVLTPIVLYIYAGIEGPDTSKVSEIMSHNNRIGISIITIITSLMFAVEGCLRMTHSKSVHAIIINTFIYPNIDSHSFYYDVFQYAGGLLFSVSLLSSILIGLNVYYYFKEYCANDAFEVMNDERTKPDIKRITKELKKDSVLMESLESQQKDNVILSYNIFCQKIIDALESSDEMTEFSYENSYFNNIKTSYKVLLVSSKSISCYFYPMCFVIKSHDNGYKYLPIDRFSISLNIKHKSKINALPSDVRPIRQLKLHSHRDGRPDLRYNSHPLVYVYNYGILSIDELVLHVFRVNTAKDVVNSYNKMYSYISSILEQKHNNIEVLKEVKITTSENISEYKDIIKKDKKQFNSVPKSLRYTSHKTLEDCFCDIIQKRGVDILVDKNIVNIISASYKELNIDDYKDVLCKMINENFLYQFTELKKQNDFALYNISSSFARQERMNVQKVLFITQALVKAIKSVKQ